MRYLALDLSIVEKTGNLLSQLKGSLSRSFFPGGSKKKGFDLEAEDTIAYQRRERRCDYTNKQIIDAIEVVFK